MRAFKANTNIIEYTCDRCFKSIVREHVYRVHVYKDLSNPQSARVYDVCTDCQLIFKHTMGEGRGLIS